jgi:Hsp70 protein
MGSSSRRSWAPALELETLPSWLFNELRTASSVRLLMADPGIPAILARLGGRRAEVAQGLLYGGQAYDFYRAVEAAKIALSNQDTAAIEFAPLGLRVQVRRATFESMIRPELDLIAATVHRALADASVQPSHVDRVLITGGSGYIPPSGATSRRSSAKPGSSSVTPSPPWSTGWACAPSSSGVRWPSKPSDRKKKTGLLAGPGLDVLSEPAYSSSIWLYMRLSWIS